MSVALRCLDMPEEHVGLATMLFHQGVDPQRSFNLVLRERVHQSVRHVDVRLLHIGIALSDGAGAAWSAKLHFCPTLTDRTSVLYFQIHAIPTGLRNRTDRSACHRPFGQDSALVIQSADPKAQARNDQRQHRNGDRSVSDERAGFVRWHHSISVGGLDNSNEDRAPAGRQASAGARPQPFQAKATEGKAASTGNAMMWPAPNWLRVGEPARTGRLSWPALGRTSNASERGVTAGETALNFMQGRAARSARVAHNHKVVSSNLTPATSSGDGLGIHQPGSMTRGFASPRQPASGRARDRAMCPAVARSFAGRAA